MNFLSEHKKLCITLGVVIILVIIMFAIRSHNLSKRNQLKKEQSTVLEEESESSEETTEPESTEETTKYDSDLGLGNDETGRYVEIPTEAPTTEAPREDTKYKSFDLTVRNYDRDSVPDKLIDGSSCKNYLRNVSLSDFGGNFGTPLTEEDKNSRDRILVGVNQNPDDKIKDDLQSVGWLMNNMNNLSDTTCIKFTDLHVVGSLSTSHVALLCMYNWYSVFGMKDCFVLFEDMSGTLDLSNFSEGSIISFGAYRHNLKLMNVNGQRVVVVQYYAS